jgi:hypothetical protein
LEKSSTCDEKQTRSNHSPIGELPNVNKPVILGNQSAAVLETDQSSLLLTSPSQRYQATASNKDQVNADVFREVSPQTLGRKQSAEDRFWSVIHNKNRQLLQRHQDEIKQAKKREALEIKRIHELQMMLRNQEKEELLVAKKRQDFNDVRNKQL